MSILPARLGWTRRGGGLRMWYEVAFLLCAGSLVAGYLNVVTRRWPSDEHNPLS